jgi:5,10-methylenetetrahydromethanopterin reductase
MSIEFHIGILPNQTVQRAVDLGMAAEEFGYGGVWVADSHSVMRDAYAVLTLLAAKTDRIQLAAGVSPTVTRHPAVLANSWATLQEISNGRGILGIGVGESAVLNLGLKPERLAILEEKIRVIRTLLRGESVEYDGTNIRMPWSSCEVPVVMACSGPKSLQLGGRIADGVLFQVGSDPAFVRYALDNISKGAEQAGRKLADLKLYMRVACAVSENRDQARQHASNEARHKALLTDRIIDAIAIAGTPSEAIPRFKELAAMGLDGFVWPAAMPEPIPYLETFARDVMPQL